MALRGEVEDVGRVDLRDRSQHLLAIEQVRDDRGDSQPARPPGYD